MKNRYRDRLLDLYQEARGEDRSRLAAYEDTELTPEDVAELKLDIIAVRSSLVDVEKALYLACKTLDDKADCPTFEYDELPEGVCKGEEYCDCDTTECWKKYFLMKARESE